jgi:hypothetical protein
MTAWKGIVDRGFTPAEFIEYVHAIHFTQWRPSFCVVHNTQIPTFASWHSIPGHQRMANLAAYYRDEKQWSGGPHLFVADDLIWAFTPLWLPGVHSPSWNNVSWGVETVGDYDREPLNGDVEQNLCSALATLHMALGLPLEQLRFHKEDLLTDHKTCPGHNLNKARLIELTAAKILKRSEGDHLPDRPDFSDVRSDSSSTAPG